MLFEEEISADKTMSVCNHSNVTCINHYEFIRKYRCNDCGEIMMCSCDEIFGRRFLPHQLNTAKEPNTQRRIPVTLGFQEYICNACRGLPEEAHPKTPHYGSTSKIVRYYWREIYFEKTTRFNDWAEQQGYTKEYIAKQEHPDVYKSIEREVIEEFKALHETRPKYTYHEESQNDVLTKNHVEIIRLDGVYVKQDERRALILDQGQTYTAEEYAARYFEQRGYNVLFTESVPFHVLFGVFMWMLIQDISDPKVRIVGFGSRTAFDQGIRNDPSTLILTHLPEDFGTSGYYERRCSAIDEHFQRLPVDTPELLWTFDYWTLPSSDLCQYLWAHRPEDVARARKIIEILPAEIVRNILKYLIQSYWERYLGWPDLLVYAPGEYFFAEVKSSKDQLSEFQKHWIYDNTAELHLPFKLVKIHKSIAPIFT